MDYLLFIVDYLQGAAAAAAAAVPEASEIAAAIPASRKQIGRPKGNKNKFEKGSMKSDKDDNDHMTGFIHFFITQFYRQFANGMPLETL